MEEELIAKNSKSREIAESSDAASTDASADTSVDVLDEERPEMPDEMGEMTGGPMGGGFPGEITTAQNSTNEWLAPMIGAGITSGVVIIAAVVIGWMIVRMEKRLKKVG